MLSGTARRTSSPIGGRPYRLNGSAASRGRANTSTAQTFGVDMESVWNT
eukprot:CAMPEP_0178989352 /NCGR_PEP_ID=MMETSP0795-20121207/4310_1 /TAXON_ID=88552 /ORGANISM="Amoebophrya sp., Strain Ameob2" /LENGTH=48 /DNA_ID= /DNA_START= /DNA_END= /DNA_ORIENTATION=